MHRSTFDIARVPVSLFVDCQSRVPVRVHACLSACDYPSLRLSVHRAPSRQGARVVWVSYRQRGLQRQMAGPLKSMDRWQQQLHLSPPPPPTTTTTAVLKLISSEAKSTIVSLDHFGWETQYQDPSPQQQQQHRWFSSDETIAFIQSGSNWGALPTVETPQFIV